MNGIPIMKLELEGMRYAVRTALMQHAAALDIQLNEAVDAYCTEENLGQVIRQTVKQEIDCAVKEEIQRFFRCSEPGRAAIREAVLKHLDEQFPQPVV